MKEIWYRVESEKPNCSAIIHAVQDSIGITITEAIVSIPKKYKGQDSAIAGLKRNGFVIEELLFDIEQQFENEET